MKSTRPTKIPLLPTWKILCYRRSESSHDRFPERVRVATGENRCHNLRGHLRVTNITDRLGLIVAKIDMPRTTVHFSARQKSFTTPRPCAPLDILNR